MPLKHIKINCNKESILSRRNICYRLEKNNDRNKDCDFRCQNVQGINDDSEDISSVESRIAI